jgi:hypothetical protein
MSWDGRELWFEDLSVDDGTSESEFIGIFKIITEPKPTSQ